MRKFIIFWRIPFDVKCMLFEAFIWAAKYRWLILHKPFISFAGDLGQERTESAEETPQAYIRTLNAVAWAVDRVCRRTPWESMCLVRAFCAKRMLVKRGIPATVYTGVCKDEQGKLLAHAWVRCGTYYVTGGNGSKEYTVTNFFT